jgi:hypothetical protein
VAYIRSNTVPCRYCTGEVSFFTSFTDPRTGITHYAATYGKRVFWKCSNPNCPGPGGQLKLDVAA